MVRTAAQWKAVKQLPLPKAAQGPSEVPIETDRVVPVEDATAALFSRLQKDGTSSAVRLNIKPRRMWGCDAGGGYCGECCFQTALLYFGNYCSQERVRYLASNEELLIGVHDSKVAERLRLVSESVAHPGEAVLSWAAQHLAAGHIVIAGWVGFIEGGTPNDEYDHIMPLVGIEFIQTAKGKSKVSAVDYLDLYYNRIPRVTRNDNEPNSDGPLLSSNKEAIARRTKQWDSDDDDDDDSVESGSTASVNSGKFDRNEDKDFYTFPAHTAYAVAVCGVEDPKDELKRCVLDVSSWEEPDWGAENEKNRKPCTLQVSITIFDLDAGKPYVILRFDELNSVPKGGDFLASGKWTKCFTFEATASTVAIRNFDAIPSNGTYFYRVVEMTQ